MLDWPARIKTFSGFASKPLAVKRAMARNVMIGFIVFRE
jgi:hypothetical protein